MLSAYEGTDNISYFHEEEIYHTVTPYIISRQRYIIEKHNTFMLLILTVTLENLLKRESNARKSMIKKSYIMSIPR